jgi:hypothetical protein
VVLSSTNYLHTPRSRFLLEKLTGSQSRYSGILRNQKVHCLIYKCLPPVPILSEIDPVLVLHHNSCRPVLILSVHLRLGFPSGLIPSGFLTKTLYAPLLSSVRAACPAHLLLLDLITRNKIWWGVQIIKKDELLTHNHALNLKNKLFSPRLCMDWKSD